MKHIRITLGTLLALVLAWTQIAIAQADPVEFTTVESPSLGEKIIDPSLASAPVSPEAVWDGEKPFMPDVQAARSALPERTLSPQLLDAFRPVARNAFNLTDVSVQEGRIVVANGETRVAVSFDGEERVVRLHPYALRSPDARLVVQVEGGMLVDTPWPEPATYRGTIDGMDADVAASIRDGKVSMLVLPQDPNQPTWHMQPLSDAVAGMPQSLHVVYRQTDLVPGNARCGTGDDGLDVPAPMPLPPAPPEGLPAQPANDGEGGGSGGDGDSSLVANVRCQIALDADYEYYQACGSSVLAVIYEMERVMNHVGLIYQNQVAIAYTETFIIVRSAVGDPYNTGLTGSGMRDEFRNHWVANHAGVTRDVAHLFSNRSSTDGFIGFAYFAGICNNNNSANSGHCWSSTFWSTDIANKVGTVAHELGHEWNAVHCDGNAGCGIMNSNINGSWSFGTPSANLIIAHRDSRPCLDVWQNPTYVNWSWGGAETGSISNPWNTIFEGLDACLVGGTLYVQAGNYFQNPNIFKAKTINAVNGTVRIGN